MTVEARLARLERANRWIKWGVAALVVTTGVIMLFGREETATFPDLEVRSLTLKDEKGLPRARLRVENGRAMLSLCDGAGEDRLVLASERNCGLHLNDADGTLRSSLALSVNGDPSLVLWDSKGVGNVILQSQAGGRPLLRMQDGKRRLRAAVGMLEDSPTFAILDSNGSITWESPK